MNLLLIACARDEGPHLAEWAAYHRAIGFTEILVYSNALSDGSGPLLDRMSALGAIRHIPNEEGDRPPGFSPQKAALFRAMQSDEWRRADWAMTLDIDEYLNIRVGEGRLSDLFAAAPADLFSPTELFFAPEEGSGPLIARQIWSERRRRPRHPRRRGVKTLFRPSCVRVIGVHRPVIRGAPVWLDGSGAPVEESFRREMRHGLSLRDGHRLLSVNHYALRSLGDFLIKAARGDAWHPGQDRFDLDYWRRRNLREVEEPDIPRLVPAMRAHLDAWRADPDFAAAEAATVAQYRTRIEALENTPKLRALAERIRSL